MIFQSEAPKFQPPKSPVAQQVGKIENFREFSAGGGIAQMRLTRDGLSLGGLTFIDARFSVDFDGNVIMESATINGATIIGATITGSTVVLGNSGVSAGEYGEGTKRFKLTVNAQGLITSATEIDEDFEIGAAKAFYIGDLTTDGSWRIARLVNDLVIERRVAGAWVTKQTILA